MSKALRLAGCAAGVLMALGGPAWARGGIPAPVGPPPQFANPVGFATGVGSHPAVIAAGDFDGDGRQDLVTSSGSNVAVELLLGRGDGTFAPTRRLPNINNGGVFIPVAGDLNGDGRLDLIGAGPVETVPGNPNASSSDIGVVLGQGDGTFGPVIVDHSTAGTPSTTADLDADGRLDVVSVNSGRAIAVSLGNGDGTLRPRVVYPVGKVDSAFGTSSPRQVAVADVNGDGRRDLVTANETSACVAGPRCPPNTGTAAGDVSVLFGTGDGSFQPAVNWPAAFPRSVAVGDLNGDGAPDIAIAGANDIAQVLLNRGAGTFAPPITLAAGSSPFGVVIRDFDGDSRPDVAVSNQGGSLFNGRFAGSVSFIKGNGDGTFGPRADYRANGQPVALTAADFNGDGHPDLAVPNPGDNTVSVLVNLAPGVAPAPVPGGGGGNGGGGGGGKVVAV